MMLLLLANDLCNGKQGKHNRSSHGNYCINYCLNDGVLINEVNCACLAIKRDLCHRQVQR